MPKSAITWAGVSSRDLGLVVDQIPNLNRPARKADVYNVPGRDGDIVVMQDAWENVDQSYTIWGHGSARNSATAIGYTISEWLFAPTGYQELSDSFDPGHFRKAYFLGPFDVENTLTRYGRATITFSCDPRRFVAGVTPITLSATGNVTNPTPFTARPAITVHGSGNGTIECGGNTITIAGIYDGMVLDCDAQGAYYPGVNLNSLVSGSFPVIPGGTQTITITGGITSVEVAPNWWTL